MSVYKFVRLNDDWIARTECITLNPRYFSSLTLFFYSCVSDNTWKYSSENGWPPYLMKKLQVYPPSDTNQDGSWSVAVGAEYPCRDDVTHYCNGPLAPGSSFSLATIGYVGESKYPVLSESSSQLTTGTCKAFHE